jgi:hypothetical protein
MRWAPFSATPQRRNSQGGVGSMGRPPSAVGFVFGLILQYNDGFWFPSSFKQAKGWRRL